MAVSSIAPVSIPDIEQQIAAVTAALEQARAENYAAAEAAFLAAQKAVASAQEKVNELSAKAVTAAAQTRLTLARAVLEQQEETLTATKASFDALKVEQEAAQEFSAKVDLLLAGKKLGKKIKFTKKEKAVLKADKKSAKKIAKAEKKIAKDEKQQAKKLAKTLVKRAKAKVAGDEKNAAAIDVPIEQEKSATKQTVAKKAPAKKPATKKIAPAIKAVNSVVEEKPADSPALEVTPKPAIEASVEVPLAVVPETISIEAITKVNPEPRDAGIENLDSNADA
jgi:colicin import membrane protein